MEPDSCVPTDSRNASQLADTRMWALAQALDGRSVDGDTGTWTVAVHGVHGDGRHWWIQVGRADDASVSVVLRCSRFTMIDHLLTALRRWLPAPAYRLQVLDSL